MQIIIQKYKGFSVFIKFIWFNVTHDDINKFDILYTYGKLSPFIDVLQVVNKYSTARYFEKIINILMTI